MKLKRFKTQSKKRTSQTIPVTAVILCHCFFSAAHLSFGRGRRKGKNNPSNGDIHLSFLLKPDHDLHFYQICIVRIHLDSKNWFLEHD